MKTVIPMTKEHFDKVLNEKRCHKHNITREFVDPLLASDWFAVEIDWKTAGYKSAKIARGTILTSIRRSGRPVKVHCHGDRVFIERIDREN